ncbi:hypothetical protein DMH04_50035 [Kibdelosporangium aridum]|uniref:Uncharacterized protein n=1 Tax=Kibdelosporangium aridum TaxID=2030 RepID=A0A428YBL2_KIBAR|nr:hypothetical protein [Kibdelosporangium aridum]RSM65003.1 hypothetical protein DMH04_50035 [Kibdelosporangium aridum]
MAPKHLKGLRAEQLRRPTFIGPIRTVMPRDNNMFGEVGIHRPGKKIPVLPIGLELLEIRDLILETQSTSIDVHAVRGIRSYVP